MPKCVDIEVFPIAKTTVDRDAVQRWMDYLNVKEFEIPDAEVVSDPALVIALAAKRCYLSFEVGLNPNISKVRKDYTAYFDNLLASRHGSVLEHAVYSFAIEGVSRVFTAEMNRHRAGMAISEGSLRFIRFDKEIPYWMPTSLHPHPDDDIELRDRKVRSALIFDRAFKHQENCYAELLEIWDMDDSDKNFSYKKKVTSCLRRIVGMGVATGGVWSGNIRALRHIIAMRTDAAAEEEIFYVFDKIAKIIFKTEPLLFGDFRQHDAGAWLPKNWKV